MLQNICRTAYTWRASVEYMGVDHCRADVLAPLQEVNGKGMAEAVAAGGLLHHAWIEVMTTLGASCWVMPPA
ncbi:MAG: hypothetical protein RLZZ609_2498 [Cyanobacteriota bacterium]|jgi:hypothetical protein